MIDATRHIQDAIAQVLDDLHSRIIEAGLNPADYDFTLDADAPLETIAVIATRRDELADASKRYTATTTGRVVDRASGRTVTEYGANTVGVRAAMNLARRLNDSEARL